MNLNLYRSLLVAFRAQVVKLNPAEFAMVQFRPNKPEKKAKGIVIHSVDVVARPPAEQDVSVALGAARRHCDKCGMWQRESESAERTLVCGIVPQLFPQGTFSAHHLPVTLGTFGHNSIV
jgi:hypothetical protein